MFIFRGERAHETSTEPPHIPADEEGFGVLKVGVGAVHKDPARATVPLHAVYTAAC